MCTEFESGWKLLTDTFENGNEHLWSTEKRVEGGGYLKKTQ